MHPASSRQIREAIAENYSDRPAGSFTLPPAVLPVASTIPANLTADAWRRRPHDRSARGGRA